MLVALSGPCHCFDYRVYIRDEEMVFVITKLQVVKPRPRLVIDKLNAEAVGRGITNYIELVNNIL